MAECLTPVYTIGGSTNPSNWGIVPTAQIFTWDAVICNWSANGYRLPTEAEWEYAARGATNNPDYLYSGSDDIDSVAWNYSNSGCVSHQVGTKAPNQLGIYDMSGNVWEYCWDWYDSNYYNYSPDTNPQGPVWGSLRVLRGGNSGCWDLYCRFAIRCNGHPHYRIILFGFRVCRTAL